MKRTGFRRTNDRGESAANPRPLLAGVVLDIAEETDRHISETNSDAWAHTQTSSKVTWYSDGSIGITNPGEEEFTFCEVANDN